MNENNDNNKNNNNHNNELTPTISITSTPTSSTSTTPSISGSTPSTPITPSGSISTSTPTSSNSSPTTIDNSKIRVIYIGNLPSDLSTDEIKLELMKITSIMPLEFIRKGHFGFLSYSSHSDASKAISLLNGKYLNSKSTKTLIAQYSKSRDDKLLIDKYIYLIQLFIGICPFDQQQLYLLEKSHRTLYIGNINPYSMKQNILNNYFTKYGNIRDITIVKDKETGTDNKEMDHGNDNDNKGYAFIIYEKWISALNALIDISNTSNNKLLIDDKYYITVQPSRPPKNIVDLGLLHGITDYNGYPTPAFQIILQYIQHNNRSNSNGNNSNILNYMNINRHKLIIVDYYQNQTNGRLLVQYNNNKNKIINILRQQLIKIKLNNRNINQSIHSQTIPPIPTISSIPAIPITIQSIPVPVHLPVHVPTAAIQTIPTIPFGRTNHRIHSVLHPHPHPHASIHNPYYNNSRSIHALNPINPMNRINPLNRIHNVTTPIISIPHHINPRYLPSQTYNTTLPFGYNHHNIPSVYGISQSHRFTPY